MRRRITCPALAVYFPKYVMLQNPRVSMVYWVTMTAMVACTIYVFMENSFQYVRTLTPATEVQICGFRCIPSASHIDAIMGKAIRDKHYCQPNGTADFARYAHEDYVKFSNLSCAKRCGSPGNSSSCVIPAELVEVDNHNLFIPTFYQEVDGTRPDGACPADYIKHRNFCRRVKNVFVPGAEEQRVVFNFGFRVESPSFLSVVPAAASKAHTKAFHSLGYANGMKTILFNPAGEVDTVFEPAVSINVSLGDLLRVAAYRGQKEAGYVPLDLDGKYSDPEQGVETNQAPEAHEICWEYDTAYMPEGMRGTNRTKEDSPGDCQTRCRRTPGCKYFGYYPDRGCMLQDSRAVAQEVTGALSGRGDCGGKVAGPTLRMTGVVLTVDIIATASQTCRQYDVEDPVLVRRMPVDWDGPVSCMFVTADRIWTEKDRLCPVGLGFRERKTFGAKIIFRPTGSFQSVDSKGITETITMFFVLIQIPLAVVYLFASTMLGHLSAVYNGVIHQVVEIRQAFNGLAARLLAHSGAFMDLVRADDYRYGLTEAKILDRCGLFFGHTENITAVELNRYADFVFEGLRMLSSTSRINLGTFCAACAANEPLSMSTFVNLVRRDRKRGLGERIFTDQAVRDLLDAAHDAEGRRSCRKSQGSWQFGGEAEEDAIQSESTLHVAEKLVAKNLTDLAELESNVKKGIKILKSRSSRRVTMNGVLGEEEEDLVMNRTESRGEDVGATSSAAGMSHNRDSTDQKKESSLTLGGYSSQSFRSGRSTVEPAWRTDLVIADEDDPGTVVLAGARAPPSFGDTRGVLI